MLADPQMPATSTLLDQAHNANEASPEQAPGYHREGRWSVRHHGFSRSSLCKVTSEQAPRNLLIERKLFMMKAFHHPDGSQKAFLTGLAHLYNLVPYQRRAQHAGRCGVEVEGGRVPTRDWFLNLQILTSGGFQ